MHEHVIASANARDIEQHVVRGQVRDGQRCGMLERQLLRNAKHKLWRNAHGVGLAAEARKRHDAIFHCQLANAAANGVNFTRAFVAHDRRQGRCVGIQSLSSHDVRKVEPSGSYADAYLVRCRLGIRALPDFERFRAAGASRPKCAHAA
jgi:hypothetical protein